MRTTSLLRDLLGLKHTVVLSWEWSENSLIIEVKPTWRKPRCPVCGEKCTTYDHQSTRAWRHLDFGGMPVVIRYPPRRASCSSCGVLTEQVPWAGRGSRYTRPFEQHAAFLAQKTSKTAVTVLMRVAWRTVGSIIERVVARDKAKRPDPLDGLRNIGVDELSYRKRREYVTVVIDHDSGHIVWAAKGKSAATLGEFFEELGERAQALLRVTLDLAPAYIKAVRDHAPQAKVVADRFHVQRLAHEALDEVRRVEVRKSERKARRALKSIRYALHKNPWNLTMQQRLRLEQLKSQNERIYEAYLLKESLAAILDRRQRNVALGLLDDWCNEAEACDLAPFNKLARTLRKHRESIGEYIATRLSNGRIEATNGRARVITRQAFGFHSAAALISMLFLCCGGVVLNPAHLRPFFTHN